MERIKREEKESPLTESVGEMLKKRQKPMTHVALNHRISYPFEGGESLGAEYNSFGTPNKKKTKSGLFEILNIVVGEPKLSYSGRRRWLGKVLGRR